jgi:hypothetical protein
MVRPGNIGSCTSWGEDTRLAVEAPGLQGRVENELGASAKRDAAGSADTRCFANRLPWGFPERRTELASGSGMDVQLDYELVDGAIMDPGKLEMSSGREKLDFATTVEEAFCFLGDYGFRLRSSESTILRYASERVFVNVYHGRSSYELGIEVGPLQIGGAHGQGYPLGAFVRLADPNEAARLRYFMATTQHEVRIGVERLAHQVKHYVRRALVGDQVVFTDLARQQEELSQRYAAEVLAGQMRPLAEEAFRVREYERVIEVLSKIEGELTPAEKRKLEYARRHTAKGR